MASNVVVLFPIDPDGTINPNNTNSLPGADALDSADIIVMLLRRIEPIVSRS